MNSLRDIPSHAFQLASVLNAIAFEDGQDKDSPWNLAGDWLLIAAGTRSVSLDRATLNPQFGWCSEADYYYLKQDRFIEKMVHELVRFNFIWGALETIGTIIFGKNIKGKIIEACKYINNYNTGHLEGYTELLLELKRHNEDGDYRKTEKEFGIKGSGLKIVYSLRNRFAHGALNFPDFPDEDQKTLIHISSSIVLMSIQMLLCAYVNVASLEISDEWREIYEDDVSLKSKLLSVHIAD